MSESALPQPAENPTDTPLALAAPAPEPTGPEAGGPGLAAMLDIPVRLTVELGRAELTLAEVFALRPRAVIELDRLPGDPVDLLANGRLIARGEILVINEAFALRVTEMVSSSSGRSEAA